MTRIAEHVEDCMRCLAAVEAVVERQEHASEVPRVWRGWLAAAAALAILLIGVTVMRETISQWLRPKPSLARLAALAPADARIVEPRLSGGFAWAPYRGALRASADAVDGQRLMLGGVAGQLIQDAARDDSADAQHSAGVAMVLVGQPEQAIERLRVAAERDPNNAQAWSDLAAARYSAALDLGRPSLYPEALASADRALRIDPQSAEGRFNRALILERLGLLREARVAWQSYLEVDASSPWATEARQRLANLPAAAAVRDPPQRSRAWGEAELLGRWGDAVLRADDAEAATALAEARAIEDALAKSRGEMLLRDAAERAAAHPSLAEAHVIYRRGRIAYSKQQLTEAAGDLRRAAALFAVDGSPMALMARDYAANVRYDQNDVAAARTELERLLGKANAQPHYIALGAHVRWELGLCLAMDDDWNEAQTQFRESAERFQRLAENTNVSATESLLASTLMAAGRPDEAWAARARSFRALSAGNDDARLAVGIADSARMELRAARYDVAASLMDLETAAVRATGNDVLLANTLVRQSVLQATRAGDRALPIAEEAAAVAQRIADPALRARAQTDAKFARSAALLRNDPRQAQRLISDAIAEYTTRDMLAFLPESHLLRARAALQTGDRTAAQRDLDEGIRILERFRDDSVVGTGVLDAGNALFHEAIRLALDRGDASAAFVYAERSRGANPRSDAEIRQRLGDGVAILELVALPDETVVFCLDAHGMTVARSPASPARQNYDTLIRPSERALARAKQLIIVADPSFEHLPFAALYDSATGRYLIERMAVATASSATSLQTAPRAAAPSSVLAVALPSGEAQALRALPETEQEIVEIERMYPSAAAGGTMATFTSFLEAASHADVVHIIGHTERLANDFALRFGDAGRVSWKTIARASLPRRGTTIVLAACETLQSSRALHERTMSLGHAFLAAGAGTVIGTLAPIADRDARQLFRAVHRELAAGADPLEAVRRAQLQALSSKGAAWQSIAVVTTRLPQA